MERFSVRTAGPGELEALIAIDDASSSLYAQAGISMSFDHDHPFVVAEAQRWAAAIERGDVYLACDPKGQPIGFTAAGMVDDQPYLDQLSVLPACMRRGVGAGLLQMVIAWSAGRSLWLTTYSSVPWNRPFYERHGFVIVPEPDCGPELREILDKQRAALPEPDDRIAMVRAG
ncbi:N-acetyltransferase [Mangrovimicrobium sediminis]|uniref:N-acetyltransferase n=1 Tax=Mangrovimicrobium sediminis TaxID=2562682 RepID=A0A4Z0M9I9_9GAMM|nr:GNAT family N-acetyltransferase [Haliea sp. SAOS-164]TGD76070.1 N-acetyltransferase [Haliea sp. SAOS-164]